MNDFDALLARVAGQAMALGLPVVNQFIPESNLSEVMRMIISNGIIIYALTQTGGASRE